MTRDDHREPFIEAERRKMLEAKTIKDAKRIRDEHRAKCLGAIAEAYYYEQIDDDEKFEDAPTDVIQACMESAASLLDSIHDLARVNPIEATEEMVRAGLVAYNAVIPIDEDIEDVENIFDAMSDAGRLTNPRERKP